MMSPLTKTTFLLEGRIRQQASELFYSLYVDGHEIDLEKSLAVRLHSPDGFNWGYGGSGPAQSALALCLFIFDNTYVAQKLYQSFKETFVARWPQGQSFYRQIDLTDFLIDHRDKLREATVWEAEEAEMAGWQALETAESLLYPPDPEPPTPPAVAPATAFKLGDVVVVGRAFLDSPAGALALVYDVYAGDGVSVITSEGDDLGGFAPDDQQRYFTFSHHVPGFCYVFKSVTYLQADWRNGLFRIAFAKTAGEPPVHLRVNR